MAFITKLLTITVALVAIGLYFFRDEFRRSVCTSSNTIEDKVVIITGANTGIGKATALDLVKRGGRVYLACRSLERCHNAADEIQEATKADDSRVITMKLDLSSFTSIRHFAQEFKKRENKLDILVNNAGIMYPPYTLTEDGHELTFQVNHLGHFLLTHLLMDLLRASDASRVINVSSLAQQYGTINFEDLEMKENFDGGLAYCQSKLANVLFTRELAKRLQGTAVTTYSVHPGMVSTELGRQFKFVDFPVIKQLLGLLAKSSHIGAQTSICCAVDPQLANQSGKYYRNVQEVDPGPKGTDDATAEKLWDVSVELTGLAQTVIN